MLLSAVRDVDDTLFGSLLPLLWTQLCHAQFPKQPNVAPVAGWPSLHWGMTPQRVYLSVKQENNSRRPGYFSNDNTSQTWGCTAPCQYCSSTKIGRATRTAHSEEEYGSAPGSLLSRLELANYLCSYSKSTSRRAERDPDDHGHLFRCLDKMKANGKQELAELTLVNARVVLYCP